jgi:hypothetical protein
MAGTSKRRASPPRATRPHIPGYGLPTSRKGLLPWSHVAKRMKESQTYWLNTTDSDGRPHSVPVMGVWVEDRLWFGGGPEVRWARNLRANPLLAVHLESGENVVIMEGDARLANEPADLMDRVGRAYKPKYGFEHPPPFWTIDPTLVLAWTDFVKDPTRWRM